MKKFFILVLAVTITYGQSNLQSGYIKETRLVKDILTKIQVSEVKHYCIKGQLSCRSMYKSISKINGQPVPFYFDTFSSADRQVGSTCYVIPTNDSNRYLVYSDMVFDGQVGITWKSPLYAQVIIEPVSNTFKFLNMKFPKLGTTQYVLGSMTQTDRNVILEGTEYDEKNPNHKVPLRVEYLRVNP